MPWPATGRKPWTPVVTTTIPSRWISRVWCAAWRRFWKPATAARRPVMSCLQAWAATRQPEGEIRNADEYKTPVAGRRRPHQPGPAVPPFEPGRLCHGSGGQRVRPLDVLARREVELVLLDSMMPGLSGIELLRQLRQRFSPARLPIIMVTALGESESVVEALNLGANDYISKPVDFPVALARIKAQLERKRSEHALRASEERYALAARGANDGLWDWDLETQRVYFSTRWKAMLGYEEAEIGDGPEEWLSRVHKEDRAALGAELAAHWNATANKECAIEHRVLHKDGSYRWMLSRGVVERDGQGKATRMAGSQ